MSNYRPVSLLSSISKLFEYAMLSRLLPFLHKCKVLVENQHGFTKNKSTISAIMEFYNSIVGNFENKQYPLGVFCDLSKAFDCVDLEILLHKLYCYGIRGVAANWFSSYLKNRSQCVQINSCVGVASSNTIKTSIGVPQGSILGAIMFILYTNDLSQYLRGVKVVSYADDISLLITEKTEQEIEDRTNSALRELYDWFCANKLYLNSSKTNCVIFHPYQKVINYNFNINIGNIRQRM